MGYSAVALRTVPFSGLRPFLPLGRERRSASHGWAPYPVTVDGTVGLFTQRLGVESASGASSYAAIAEWFCHRVRRRLSEDAVNRSEKRYGSDDASDSDEKCLDRNLASMRTG